MKEEIVSFEVAKLAKELGFDWNCFHYYNKFKTYDMFRYFEGDGTGVDRNSTIEENDVYSRGLICTAPTQSLFQKWLREEHEIIVNVMPIDDWDCWGYSILGRDDMKPFRRLENQYSEYPNYKDALDGGLFNACTILKENL